MRVVEDLAVRMLTEAASSDRGADAPAPTGRVKPGSLVLVVPQLEIRPTRLIPLRLDEVPDRDIVTGRQPLLEGGAQIPQPRLPGPLPRIEEHRDQTALGAPWGDID